MSDDSKKQADDLIRVASGQWQPETVHPGENTYGAEAFESWAWEEQFQRLCRLEAELVEGHREGAFKAAVEGSSIPAVWKKANMDPIECYEQLMRWAKSHGGVGHIERNPDPDDDGWESVFWYLSQSTVDQITAEYDKLINRLAELLADD